MKSKQVSLVIEDSTPLQQEVNRMKEALQVYANPDNWIGSTIWQAKEAGWKVAQDALAEPQASPLKPEGQTEAGEIVFNIDEQEVTAELAFCPPDETGAIIVFKGNVSFEEPDHIVKFRSEETNWEWKGYADWIKERGAQTE